jgi:hypothetical protein
MNEQPSKIRIMAEYECFPIWIIRGAQTLNVPPRDLEIDQDLAGELQRWATDFDMTYKPDDPLSSGFPDADDEREFNERGQRLARRVATAIGPKFEVTYFDLLAGHDIPVGYREA